MADWIAVDWGTTNLRAWAMGADNSVIASAASGKGMSTLRPEDFENALLDLTGPWLDRSRVTPVVACGMVGAKTGWTEADYRVVPQPAAADRATMAPCKDPRHTVAIIAGLSQTSPPDVMRGEETQIAGFLRTEPDFAGTLCLPGTHTKWVQVAGGQITRFRTVMTGEMFDILSRHSTLRLTVGPDGWDDRAFSQAIGQVFRDPSRITADLFGLRSSALVAGMSPATGRARLSGHLIGAELAGTRDFWEGPDVCLIGGSTLARLYADALGCVSVQPRILDGERLTLDGLIAAHDALKRS